MAAFSSASIATIAAVASAGMGVVGAISQGQAASKQAKFQAQVAQQQAAHARKLAAAQEDDFRHDQSRLMAQRRAALGGAGVEAGTGSPLFVTTDLAAEVELNALRIRQGGEAQATRLEQAAQLFRLAGKNAKRGAMFRAGASLLSGAAKVAGPSFAGVGSSTSFTSVNDGAPGFR